MREHQIVIPKKLRSDLLDKIHYNHMGVDKSLSRAREFVYWPMMSKKIKDRVGNCLTCLQFAKAIQKETLINRDLPTGPWEMLAMDGMYLKNKNYLIVVDMYSKYPEIVTLRSQTSKGIVEALKTIFSRHGKPNLLYSDQGTNLFSQELLDFAKEWQFECKTSSPIYAQSNGFIGRHIQSIKSF